MGNGKSDSAGQRHIYRERCVIPENTEMAVCYTYGGDGSCRNNVPPKLEDDHHREGLDFWSNGIWE